MLCTLIVYMNRGKNMCFKKEILLTRDLNQLNRAKDILVQNNIKYNVVTNTITNPGRHHGVTFINMSDAFQYHIYVKRRDFNIARKILGN